MTHFEAPGAGTPGPGRIYAGEHLNEIAFPIGGIGSGTISLAGSGRLRDAEFFNHPAKGRDLPYTFFALAARSAGASHARVLEQRIQPPYTYNGSGVPTSRVAGLPRFRHAAFRGEYPFAWLRLEDPSLPVTAELEAWNPFIPMETDASGLPVAVFTWRLANTGDEPVDASIAFNVLNAVGWDAREPLHNRYAGCFGGNLNEPIRLPGLTGIEMKSVKLAADDRFAGTMAVATTAPDSDVLLRWERARWWDDAQAFWDAFAGPSRVPWPDQDPDPSPDGQTDVGTVSAHAVVPAQGSAAVTFVLTWHFPNLTNTWNREEAVKGRRLGNWYTRAFESAADAARHVVNELPALRAGTRSWHFALYTSTLPEAVLDAVGANTSLLRTATVLRTEDGRMNAFEGCNDLDGCCPMNCTHVWNYAQTAAFLFPELERSVRRTDFLANTRPSGDMSFRTLLPLTGELWAYKPAADGQLGTVMKAWREWLQCGDRSFLLEIWPGVRRALDYAASQDGWDSGRDGVLRGEQHNTYDIEFHGANTMCGSFYLGALAAGSRLARVVGDEEAAARWTVLLESGRSRYSELLWNGEWFEQESPDTPPPDGEPRYQYWSGCLADQVLGCWFGRVVGIDDLLPREQVRAALASIVRYNFRRSLDDHASVQRVYALNDEGGVLLCTWPRAGRPRYPFPYADEVWTGIEYQVAAHCMYEGLVDDGLAIVRAVRDRHDGRKRNPWNEFECGHHYARAMSSWSLLLALSGFHYDAHTMAIEFDPQVSADGFRCAFTAGTGWGRYSQIREDGRLEASLAVDHGSAAIAALRLPIFTDSTPTVAMDGTHVASEVRDGIIRLAAPVTLRAGAALTVTSAG